MYIVACVVVVIIVVLAVIPWKYSIKDFAETNHPGACLDCNKSNCRGCALEFLTKEQADKVSTQITQQAIADSSVVYTKRFDKKEV